MEEIEYKKEKKGHPLLKGGRQFTPYVKELRKLDSIKSVNACLIFAELEYLFEYRVSKNGHLIRYVEPPEKRRYNYKPGESWVEELGFSAKEFRRGFREIGVPYNSMTEFMEAKKVGSPFKGKFYCSYFHKPTYMTFYFRNKGMVDVVVKALMRSVDTDRDGDM